MESIRKRPWKSVSCAQFALSFGRTCSAATPFNPAATPFNPAAFETQRTCRAASLIRPSASPLPTRSCRRCVCTICRTRTSYCRAPVKTCFSCICRCCSCIDSCACRGTTRACIYCFPRSSRRAFKLRRCPIREPISALSPSKQLLLRILRVNVLDIQIPVAIFVG